MDTLTYTEVKTVKQFCESLFSEPDYRETIEAILSGSDDFEIANVRFIRDEAILDTLAEELASDLYCLGCFTASAIAYVTNWPIELIEAAQQGEQYEAIGNGMSNEQIKALADYYSTCDGYGHHFNHHDFEDKEFAIGDDFYHVFDNHEENTSCLE